MRLLEREVEKQKERFCPGGKNALSTHLRGAQGCGSTTKIISATSAFCQGAVMKILYMI